MDDHDFVSIGRDTGRMHTPDHSDEDLPQFSNLSLGDKGEKNFRSYTFTKDGRSWAKHVCNENTNISQSDLRKRAKRLKKPTNTVQHQMEKMSPPRRNAVEELLDRTNRSDFSGDEWEIAAIDIDNPDITKRTGEVLGFTVILAKVNAMNSARPRTGSLSQERRRASNLSPNQDFAVPTNRGSKAYHRSGRQSPGRDDRGARSSQTFKNNSNAFEDDLFGTKPVFDHAGRPINSETSATHNNDSLPSYITLDQPIGASKQRKSKQNKDRFGTGSNDDFIDLDAAIGGDAFGRSNGHNDLLGTTPEHCDDHDFGRDHDHEEYGLDNPIEVVDDLDNRSRGRKNNNFGWNEKKPKRGISQHKSKSRPRMPSISIPKTTSSRPIEVTTAGGRRDRAYNGSFDSATDPSIRSDQSIIEAEIEEYSSSNPSHDGFGHHRDQDYRETRTSRAARDRDSYMPASSKSYERVTNYHRRGPPSPRQTRYDTMIDPDQILYSATSRRPRGPERFISDGAIQRYSYTPTATTRGPYISQYQTPRFTSQSAIPAMYPTESGLMYPSEIISAHPSRRRESIQLANAEMYMANNIERDREMEMLAREAELARNERDFERQQREWHQEVAFQRRASMRERGTSFGAGGLGLGRDERRNSRYAYEPRNTRRYADAYHP